MTDQLERKLESWDALAGDCDCAHCKSLREACAELRDRQREWASRDIDYRTERDIWRHRATNAEATIAAAPIAAGVNLDLKARTEAAEARLCEAALRAEQRAAKCAVYREALEDIVEYVNQGYLSKIKAEKTLAAPDIAADSILARLKAAEAVVSRIDDGSCFVPQDDMHTWALVRAYRRARDGGGT